MQRGLLTIIRLMLIMMMLSGSSACLAFKGLATLPSTIATGTPQFPQAGPLNTSTPFPNPLPTQAVTLHPLTPNARSTSTVQAPTETPSIPPTNPEAGQVVVLASDLPNPDDLVLAPDGSIDISDVGDGTIRQLTPEGKISILVSGLDVPEGMAWLPDGSLAIAEQGKNRLVLFNPQTQEVTTLLRLKNDTGRMGVDGIALDTHIPNQQALVIPDSPNGVVYRYSLADQKLQRIAAGFARPVGAWVEKDGSILVVDENTNSLIRIHPDGRTDILNRNLPTPDDVLEDSSGNIYVNTLGDGSVHRISGDGSQDTILVKDLGSPQGMTFDASGNLVVTDPGNHRLIRITLP